MLSLHAHAIQFIKNSSFFQELHSLGEIIFTGSYALDTMTWPDIDVQLKLPTDAQPFTALTHLSNYLLQESTTLRFQYMNFKDYPRKDLPKGLCIGVQLLDPALEKFSQPYWKIDLWILEPEDFEQNRLFMSQLKTKMTPAHKELILQYKQSWTQQWGRPPKGASYYLYRAVVLEALKEKDSILKYLWDNGVKI